jgi:hypothetical protein
MAVITIVAMRVVALAAMTVTITVIIPQEGAETINGLTSEKTCEVFRKSF